MLEQHPSALSKCEGAPSLPEGLSFLRPLGGWQGATPTACTAQWGRPCGCGKLLAGAGGSAWRGRRGQLSHAFQPGGQAFYLLSSFKGFIGAGVMAGSSLVPRGGGGGGVAEGVSGGQGLSRTPTFQHPHLAVTLGKDCKQNRKGLSPLAGRDTLAGQVQRERQVPGSKSFPAGESRAQDQAQHRVGAGP